MGTKRFRVQEVTLWLRVDDDKYDPPSQWDWAGVLDMDSEDVEFTGVELDEIIEVPWEDED